ncbi:rod shape-determining protein MreD [Sphingobium sp. H39-3-25]|uniref:rod shape-determining protein MreD n=1 Tax=Sphingobium arseniciresistens TaxID=3030834 RepID=UPI0023B8CC31|nr:rod shape-determining protein MreD [Sphingobium arseniciresistens]
MPRLGHYPSRWRLESTPIITVMLGSMTTALPVIAQSPVMPPFGLLMLLSWRLLRPELWAAWIALPLGLFDDLMSGQPLGSAVFLWTAIMIGVDVIDRRLLWRDYWHDWLIAIFAITFFLAGGLLFARLTGGTGRPALIVPQMIGSILIFPFVARQCARIDHWRVMS